ncbi:MAG: sugar isomerase [Saprospiraceae bacterium]
MHIGQDHINQSNNTILSNHKTSYEALKSQLINAGVNIEDVVNTIKDYKVAIPSWALGAGGTRFGRFSIGGEPSNIREKLSDIGIIKSLTGSTDAVSLHIPWDIPDDHKAVGAYASNLGIKFDAMNSNTFQDQKDQKYSYKYGSLCHVDPNVRAQAVQHNIEVIDHGIKLGSKSITVWLADGSNFPGASNFRRYYKNTVESLKSIYAHLPDDWKLFLEYKPYEPNFYSMVIPDWGTSHMMAKELGEKAYTLVDLGHHLPNTNIEQIVGILMSKGMLGGFHFNDSKYGDDDLSVGAIKPYQLFLIFNELVYGMQNNVGNNPIPAWMIDASHNVKDPLEDLIQSLNSIETAYAKALLIDQKELEKAQMNNDIVLAQKIFSDAFNTDVRPLLSEARLRNNAAIDPIKTYRSADVRNRLIDERGSNNVATGL